LLNFIKENFVNVSFIIFKALWLKIVILTIIYPFS